MAASPNKTETRFQAIEMRLKAAEKALAETRRNIKWAVYLPVLFKHMGGEKDIRDIEGALMLKAAGELTDIIAGDSLPASLAELLGKINTDGA